MDSLLSIVQMPGGRAGRDAGDRARRGDQRGVARGGDPGAGGRGAGRAAGGVARGANRERSARAPSDPAPPRPGSTIGILGGGQLGRMLAVAAAQLGYRTHVLAPDRESVAAQTASSMTRADYHNRIVLADFAQACDVVTYEFENIALAPVEWLAARVPVHPQPARADGGAGPDHREEFRRRARRAAGALGRSDRPRDALEAALGDGRHARGAEDRALRLRRQGAGASSTDPDEAAAAWDAIGGRAVLEAFVDFSCEFSVLIARGADGATARWDAPVNVHREAILRTSAVPAPADLDDQIAGGDRAGGADRGRARLCRGAGVRVLRDRRRPGVQRNGAARAQ